MGPGGGGKGLIMPLLQNLSQGLEKDVYVKNLARSQQTNNFPLTLLREPGVTFTRIQNTDDLNFQH